MFCPDDAKKVKKSFLEERTKHREDRELHRKRTDSAIRIEVELYYFCSGYSKRVTYMYAVHSRFTLIATVVMQIAVKQLAWFRQVWFIKIDFNKVMLKSEIFDHTTYRNKLLAEPRLKEFKPKCAGFSRGGDLGERNWRKWRNLSPTIQTGRYCRTSRFSLPCGSMI